MNRDDFERMCQPMMDKVRAVLDAAKSSMGVSVEEVDFVEMVGGATRVPWLKRMCTESFGGKELSYTMNAEESVARGCALQAAILSPLFKVREFKVEDTTPFGITVGWKGSSSDAAAAAGDAAGDEEGERMGGGEGEYKTAVVFQAGSMMKKVKVKAKLTIHGIFVIDSAQLVEEEEYEETV